MSYYETVEDIESEIEEESEEEVEVVVKRRKVKKWKVTIFESRRLLIFTFYLERLFWLKLICDSHDHVLLPM